MKLYTLVFSGSSPHTRGAHSGPFHDVNLLGIIPAYAGSTTSSPPRAAGRGDHPRIRGEHGWPAHHIKPTMGSSPHTRGAPIFDDSDFHFSRIIPAYAGSTTPSWNVTGKPADHPRIRGEHDETRQLIADGVGSSPHTRGAL